jgi:hypothetical protein
MLNLSSAASAIANEPIFNWHTDFYGSGPLPVCPNRFKRTGRGIRNCIPARR